MNKRWILSQFFQDTSINHLVAVCASYGGNWHCPLYPTDTVNGWSLVLVEINLHQLEALREDPRCVVLPQIYDPSPVPTAVVTAYAQDGVKAGMSLAQVIEQLSIAEPAFSAVTASLD
jgi:hypothetical protein